MKKTAAMSSKPKGSSPRQIEPPKFPMSIVFDRDQTGQMYVTFSGMARVTKLAITPEEYEWLGGTFKANPDKIVQAIIAFINVREGKARFLHREDGTITVVPSRRRRAN